MFLVMMALAFWLVALFLPWTPTIIVTYWILGALLPDIVVDILAQVCFWALGGLFVSIFVRQTSVKRFREFFGLQKNPKLVIYLSNMSLDKGHAENFDSDRGAAWEEHRAALIALRLFNRTPARVPALVRDLVDEILLPSRTEVETRLSPGSSSCVDIQSTNVISIGSARNNKVREHCLQLTPYLVLPHKEGLPRGSKCILVLKGDLKDKEYKKVQNRSLAIIERVQDENGGTVVFMCVGENSDSSWEAAEYLVRHWERLSKKSCNSPFALGLQFPRGDTPNQEYVEPEELVWFCDSE